MIITMNEINLFVDSKKLPPNFAEHQKQNNVSINIHAYDAIGDFVNCLVSPNAPIYSRYTQNNHMCTSGWQK